MSWFYRHLIRPLLFSQDSESIHNRTLTGLGAISRQPLLCRGMEQLYCAPDMPVKLFGLHFPNPVGLAAGMDKKAQAVPVWEKLGFGFSELGGVTWHAQPGNPQPRMFRALDHEALINRMGFNNPGAEAMAENLELWKESKLWPVHPVGINLGKSKITPLEDAAKDYANSFRRLREFADFFVVNVSSPNTPNLRQLQDKAALDEILSALQEINRRDAEGNGVKPILVKVAPDLSFEALDEILELVGPRQIAGIVASNTTITRPRTENRRLAEIYEETGGLSGKPLRYMSNQIIRHLYRQTEGKLPIIGVGGIFNADDALAKIMSGASLVQVYTGLVYEGPSIARDIVCGLQKKLELHGVKDISALVGTIIK
ncbi:MAG: quinone-dependent dihydroorotate dehydrogenase [Limisphaerales bacterium]